MTDHTRGLGWLQSTGGALTSRQRRRLMPVIARADARVLVGWLRLAIGRVPRRPARLDLDAVRPPDSTWARAAEHRCAAQPAPLVAHCYRTWLFGLALAGYDRIPIDHEVFYVACLLHDLGLVHPVPNVCFTLAGAEATLTAAALAGVPAEDALQRPSQAAEAVARHVWPDVGVRRDGAEAVYVQAGAAVDVVGLRLWELDRSLVEAVVAAHPRGPFAGDIARRWDAESHAVPGGRAALIRRYGALPAVARLAPFHLPGAPVEAALHLADRWTSGCARWWRRPAKQ